MLIANPIYDAVFKYMMKDNKVAKLLLSAIIGKNIVNLDLRSTEVQTDKPIPVLRIDFVAKIKDDTGAEMLVILEVQKAKLPTDINRFRQYLGIQYSSVENLSEVNEPTVKYGKPLPIISIYFLGYPLDYIKAPVIKVARQYTDVTTGKIIKEKEEFIECLTHDSFIIQIRYLSQNRRTELLRVLSIFDQSNLEKDHHILNVAEENFPEIYRPVIRRLQRAISEKTVRDIMTLEDTEIAYYYQMQRDIADKSKLIEEKNKTIEEKDKALEEKDKTIDEKDKTIDEKDNLIAKLQEQLRKK